VNAVMNLRVPQNAGKFSNSFATGGLSSSAQIVTICAFWLLLDIQEK
jgi:hypothetical protein